MEGLTIGNPVGAGVKKQEEVFQPSAHFKEVGAVNRPELKCGQVRPSCLETAVVSVCRSLGGGRRDGTIQTSNFHGCNRTNGSRLPGKARDLDGPASGVGKLQAVAQGVITLHLSRSFQLVTDG